MEIFLSPLFCIDVSMFFQLGPSNPAGSSLPGMGAHPSYVKKVSIGNCQLLALLNQNKVLMLTFSMSLA